MVVLVELPKFMEQEKFNQIIEHFPIFTTNPDARIGVKNESETVSYKILSDDEYLSSEVTLLGEAYYKEDIPVGWYNIYLEPQCPMVALDKNFGMVDIEKFAQYIVNVPFKVLEVYGGYRR